MAEPIIFRDSGDTVREAGYTYPLPVASAGADTTNQIQKVQVQATYTVPLTASGLVKTGAGQLMGYVVNSCSAGATVKIWDNTSAATTVMFDTHTYTAAVSQGPTVVVLPAVKFTTGCYFTLSGTISVTPLWN